MNQRVAVLLKKCLVIKILTNYVNEQNSSQIIIILYVSIYTINMYFFQLIKKFYYNDISNQDSIDFYINLHLINNRFVQFATAPSNIYLNGLNEAKIMPFVLNIKKFLKAKLFYN